MTGWSWEHISKEVTLAMVDQLFEYWNDHPPVHELVAGYMGFKSSSTNHEHAGAGSDPQALANEMSSSGLPVGNGIRPLPPEMKALFAKQKVIELANG